MNIGSEEVGCDWPECDRTSGTHAIYVCERCGKDVCGTHSENGPAGLVYSDMGCAYDVLGPHPGDSRNVFS